MLLLLKKVGIFIVFMGGGGEYNPKQQVWLIT